MHHAADIRCRITTGCQHRGEFLQVGYGIQSLRRLLVAETAVQIGTQTYMPGISCQLAEMIEMIY